MKSTQHVMMRLPLPVPRELLRLIAGYVPAGQSRAEWIREAIRQRMLRDAPRHGRDNNWGGGRDNNWGGKEEIMKTDGISE